ncbi:DUF3093 domain-containing protein [Micromonospora cathayae]|uniref:DUF3093 domain-containing protein n=1 Tax=Micromonospora cathayae TaxID=3028804 RepID=A0ABY7ZYT9_9ACTN|nr:DUF3093 domain-containing protein [Micromonospora sp. HUAS 3]WDZ87618.1 DUF3093 domain-containing protein [Micromonospora sp. HUAS 3]
MHDSPSSPPAPPGGFTERLTLPWWLWLGGIAVGALLAVEIWMGGDGVRAWLPFAVLLPLTVAGLWWLGRIRIAVTDGELRVDDARLPVRFVADVVPLDAEGRREVLGVAADPLAFVVQRPWVGGAVQVLLDDPADPTPFWVVSTRHPVRLAEALLAARDATRPADREPVVTGEADRPATGR